MCVQHGGLYMPYCNTYFAILQHVCLPYCSVQHADDGCNKIVHVICITPNAATAPLPHIQDALRPEADLLRAVPKTATSICCSAWLLSIGKVHSA